MSRHNFMFCLLLIALIVAGCNYADAEYKWNSPKKIEGPWEINTTANIKKEDNKSILTYSIKIKNISNDIIKDVSVKPLFPEDWFVYEETSGWIGKDTYDPMETNEYTLTQKYDHSVNIKKERIKEIEIQIEWDKKKEILSF